MRKIKFLTMAVAVCFSAIVMGQDKAVTMEKVAKQVTKKLYVGLGMGSSSFQDVKFSDVQYTGPGANFVLGFSNETDKRYWAAGMDLNGTFEFAATHDATSFTIQPNFWFRYLYAVGPVKLGAKLDLLNVYFRSTPGLSNNSIYLYSASNLYASVKYDRCLSKNWKAHVNVDLAVLSFDKESSSFGFNSPYNQIEKGEFTYQSNASSPFAFKYNKLSSLNKSFKANINLMFDYKKRFTFGYQWGINHFVSVKKYPTTIANHCLVVKFNIINRK